MTKIIFAMYHSETDTIKVSLVAYNHRSFDCQKYNAKVRLNESSNISYLTRLTQGN